MVEFIFDLLHSIGFLHPVHPALTHIPMGMAMGGFTFAVTAYFLNQPVLYKSSYHCAVLGLIGIPPTIILGILDWQYSYSGDLSTPIIIKMVMAALLTLFFIAIVRIGNDGAKSPKKLLILYTLTLISAINLGFWGGELVFG